MFRFLVMTGLALATAFTAAAEEEPSRPRRKPSEMPKVAKSADGFVEVVAADIPGDSVGFRLPILQFAASNLRELERVWHLQMPRGLAGLVIYAQDGTTNDPTVVSRQVRRTNGSVVTRVWLPSPGYSDIEQLRFEVVRAYFHAWIDRTSLSPATERGSLPDWLVQGILRATNADQVDDDTRFVLNLWSDGKLPFFPALCTDLRPVKGAAAALPGYVASWMKEKRILKSLLERLAGGAAWDGRILAQELTGETVPVEQDRVSDERLARLSRAVLSPGFASDWDKKVFLSRLLLYPRFFDKNNPAQRTSYTFAEAVTLAETDETVREAAAQKAREMPFCAIGRGEALAAAAEAYRQFLLAVAHGEKPEALRPLLAVADEKLKQAVSDAGAPAPESMKDED